VVQLTAPTPEIFPFMAAKRGDIQIAVSPRANCPPPEPPDSPEVIGGPLYQRCWRRLCGNTLDSPRRRLAALVLIAWLPLLALTALADNAFGGRVALPFLHDLETQARLLATLPLFILAETFVPGRLRPLIDQFSVRGLIAPHEQARFDAALASSRRLKSSLLAELLMAGVVYLVGAGLVWNIHPLDLSNWRTGTPAAGWWLRWVSLPLVHFLLLRWYFRLFVDARLFAQVSRIRLSLFPLHPDRCAGLGFLALFGNAFIPVLLAQGFLLAGRMANRIFYAGASLADFKIDLAGVLALVLGAIFAPLLVFFPRLAALKRAGLCDFGALAHHYVERFDHRWLRSPPSGELLGSADIQSLADLSNSFAAVAEMRPIPFTLRDVVQSAGILLLPVAPLILTLVPLKELLLRLLKLLA
jgi:hypothetical protein